MDTGSAKVRRLYEEWFRGLRDAETKMLNKYSIDKVSVAVDEDYVKALMRLFQQR